MRGRGTTLASNPVMVGAITVLIVILAVFLAYNANQGLPFVPAYRVTAQVQNADGLVPGNEVRIGGARVGVIETLEPVEHDDGTTTARLDLKLDADAKPIPTDSTLTVRAQSSLGLKYLEIAKGESDEGFAEGAVLPLSASHCGNDPECQPVDLDEVLSTFDEPTRLAIQRNLFEFGNAIAARGPALNAAIGELAPLLQRLEPVGRILSAPSTRLGRLFQALRDTAGEVAPVAEIQAQMFVALDTTFGGLANVARPFIQQTIVKSPPTEDTAIATLPTIRPVPGAQRRPVRGAAPGDQGAAGKRADPRRRDRGRHPGAARRPQAQRRARADRGRAPRPRQRRRRPPGTRRAHPVQPGPRSDAAVHHPGPVGLQLRDAAGPQRGEPAEPRRRRRDVAAVHQLRPPPGPQQRGEPVVGAGERRRRRTQLPARQPVPEHRVAGPGEGVRGRQRDLPRRSDGDRKRAREPGHRDRGASPSPRRARSK